MAALSAHGCRCQAPHLCRIGLSYQPVEDPTTTLRPPDYHPASPPLAAASPVWSPLPRAPARGEVIVAMALGCHAGPGEQDYTAPLVYSTCELRARAGTVDYEYEVPYR